MLWLPVAWSVLFFVLQGCGLLTVSALQRFGGRSFRTSPSAWQVLWFGYAFVIAVLQLWSMVLPVRRTTLWFLALLAAWGPNPGHPADFNANGSVDINDFLDLLSHWGPCP